MTNQSSDVSWHDLRLSHLGLHFLWLFIKVPLGSRYRLIWQSQRDIHIKIDAFFYLLTKEIVIPEHSSVSELLYVCAVDCSDLTMDDHMSKESLQPQFIAVYFRVYSEYQSEVNIYQISITGKKCCQEKEEIDYHGLEPPIERNVPWTYWIERSKTFQAKEWNRCKNRKGIDTLCLGTQMKWTDTCPRKGQGEA